MTLVDWKETVAGASAGVIGTIIGFPFDTVKTTMQISHMSIGGATRTIYNQSGFLGFYKGVGSPLVALTALNTINFAAYTKFLYQFDTSTYKLFTNAYEWRVTASAAMVGPIASMISTPFELVKTQMQLSSTSNSSDLVGRSSIGTAIRLARAHGFLYLYTAHAVNTTREVIFLSTYFTVYQHVKYHVAGQDTKIISQSLAIPLSGGLAGAIGWLVSFPLDLIKTNIQKQAPPRRARC